MMQTYSSALLRASALATLVAVAASLTTATAQRPAGDWDVVYENETFTAALRIDGEENVLFYNCTFANIKGNRALDVRDSRNVRIEGCTFRNLDGTDASSTRMLQIADSREVTVANSEFSELVGPGQTAAIHMLGARSANITLRDNYIHDVDGNGIVSGGCSSCDDPSVHDVPNPGLRVLRNVIHDTGRKPDTQGNSPKHGMYIKATDSYIEGNTVYNCYDGAGISMRSTGIARGNTVYDTRLGAIGGSFMKPAGSSGRLVIENNVVWQTWESDKGYANLIAIECCDSYPKRYNTTVVRFNTIVIYPSARADVENLLIDRTGRRTDDRVYGNLLVDLRATTNFWRYQEEVEYKSNNFFRTNLSDFVDAGARDFRLQSSSDLVGVIASESDVPDVDFAGTPFTFPLEPGALQYVAGETPPSDPPSDPPSNLACADAATGGLPVANLWVGAEQEGNGKCNLLDGDLATRWSAPGPVEWANLDLGADRDVGGVALAFYRGAQRSSSFTILTSTDNENWAPALEGVTSDGTTDQLVTYTFPARQARYVLLVGLGNSENDWVSVTEFQALGASEVEGRSSTPFARDPAFVISPNPAFDAFRIAATDREISGVRVVNAQGAEVLRRGSVAVGEFVDVGHLAAGTYFVHVTATSGYRATYPLAIGR